MSENGPTWTLIALALLWAVFLVAFPGTENLSSAGALAAASGLAVLVSIPVLYVDARASAQAGELESRPALVVIAVLLLYFITLPAYLLFRLYRRRQDPSIAPSE